MPNVLENLHRNLTADGYQLGSFDDFKKAMSDSTKAANLYKNLSADGYQLGSQEEFFNNVGNTSMQKPAQEQAPAQPKQTKPYNPETDNMGAGVGASISSLLDNSDTEQKPVQKEPQKTVQKKAKKQSGTYKPSELDLMSFGSTIGSAQYTANNAAKGVEALGEATKKASPFGSGNVGIGNNSNLRKGKKTFDAEKGTFVDTYVTSDGRKFNDIQQANQIQGQLDDNASNVRFIETMKSLGIDVDGDKEKDINHLLGDAYDELHKLDANIESRRESQATTFAIGMGLAGSHGTGTREKDNDLDNLLSAKRLLERRINALEAARDNGGFWSGTTDVLTDASSYSFGLTDLADAKAMTGISKKIEDAKTNGTKPQLTDSEKALVRNYMLNQQAQAKNADNTWYEFGQGFGQTLSFMKDFALTGGGFMNIAKTGMNLGAKGGAKLASKALGDYMTKNLGTKALGKTIEYMGKGLGLAAGAEVGGLALNNTAQAASSIADVMNKQMGNLTVGNDGNLSFEGSKSIGEAVLKSQLKRGGENASELVGLAFDAVPGILGKVIQRTKMGQFAKKIADSKYWKGYEKAMNYLGVQSLWGEGMEEEYNMARDVLIGESGWFKDPNDPSKPAFFDGEQQLKTWETVGITSMLLRVPSMIATGTQGANYYANQYNLNTSDMNMRDVFGSARRYETVKAMIDGADNAQLAGVLNNLMNNAELSGEEKEAMFMYANDLVKLRGFNIGNVVAAANGFTEPPKVSSYAISGNSFDELDSEGNVIAHHEYDTEDEMKAGLYGAQQARFDKNLQSDINVMKARPGIGYDTMLIEYSAANGFESWEDFEALLNKPSIERTDAEQAIVEPFAKLLHDTVYDNTMLHEDQSSQDGVDAAESASIDVDNPNSENVQEVTNEWQLAQQERNQLFAQNEELKQEIEQMEKQGLSHQEIVSALETFRPNDVQTVINYYNLKARFEGMMNQIDNKINEEASNSRQRHTFKGTINGNADLSNVYTISDGTNEYYLVSGNISTDSQGKITGSDSGLIIGMDLDGSFVNISDTNGYSVIPSTQTLDQFEEQERIRLQELWTSTIDPTGSMMQQPQEESGEVEGEAGATTGTGANEPLTPATSEEQQQQEPSVTIESITGEDGVKRYELGIPVDDAIADMQADGLDVNDEADLAINEAQAELDKIKQPKTRAERVKNAQRQQELQSTIDYYNKVKERFAEQNQPMVEEQPSPTPSGLTVEEQKQLRIAEAKAKYGELFDDDFTKANDVYELASMWVGRNRNLAWEDVNGKRGLQKELGWTRKIGGDTKYIETLLAKNGEGIGIDEFVHMVWESPENDIMGEKRFTTEEIKEALLTLLKSAQSKSDVVDFALNSRIVQAEATLQQQAQMAEEQQNIEPSEVEPAPDGGLPFGAPTDEDFTNDVNENNNEAKNDVSLQTKNKENDEQESMGGPNQEGDGISGAHEAATQLLQGCSIGSDESGQSGRNKERLLAKLEESARDSGQWLDDDISSIADLKISTGGENEVYGTEEGHDVVKLNNFNFLRDDATNFEDFINRLESFNELFPDVALQLIGFAKNSKGEVCVVFKQPRIKNFRFATEEEIDAALEELDFYTDISGNWTDGQYEIADLKPNNVLVDKEGNLHFIDVVTFDSTKPGKMMKAKKPEIQNNVQSTNPIEAIEQAAQSFRQEQEEKKAYGADNKLVSQERYEELKKRMRDKLRGQLNVGVDPEMIAIGAEMAMFHIEAGARKFADYATRMILDLNDAIRPYLKAFYESARRMPGMEELSKEMDSTDYVDAFDVLSYDKQPTNTVNEHKQENNVTENIVSSQQETSEEVVRKAEDADKYRAFSQAVADDMLKAMNTGEKPYKSIKDIRAKAKSIGLEVDDEGRTDILLQELVEDGLVSAARQYVNIYMVNEMMAGKEAPEVRASRELFNDIVKLYELQPSITQRSSNRIKMQQYSTPLPMSYVADVFALKEGVKDVLEPTAGNGMMVFAVPEFAVHANELDETRLDNLRAQKFKKVTNQDATQPFEGDEQYDAIIANPPFGSAEAKDYDGKMISGLAEQIALNALSKMKDDGKASIIIGGNMEYAPNGSIKNQKPFFTYLYDHYNVIGVIDMDGKLYSKQGTTYPTRLILIDGRRSEEDRALSKIYPPTKDKAPQKATTFDELFDIAEELKKQNKTNGTEILRTPTGIALPDNNDASGNTNRSGRDGQSRQNESDGGRTESRGSNSGSQKSTREGTAKNRGRGSVGVQQPRTPGLFDSQEATPEPQPQTGGNREGGSTVNNGESRPADVQGDGAVRNRVGLAEPVKPKVEEKRELDTDKLSYRPHNTAYSLESVAPAAMVEAMDDMLSKIEKEEGNIDEFVTRELGYDSVEGMHDALAAEQVDSVAMAIYQMKKGQGMIIGDQTGVGKGRQMAALIRWACRQGKKPVFITQKADLFSDIYRDLVDIGSGELNPFIFNSDGAMVDNNGVVVHKPLSAKAQTTVFEGNQLPEGYDFAVLTYSQVNTGDAISQEESGAAAKQRGERGAKKSKRIKAGKATPKATFLRALADDNYMFLDESHTAAGKSNTGAYFQSILKTSKGVTFASATFAKRPDTMPMYALRTAMSKAKVKPDELIKIIENGGVTLQEIMSRALTEAGQMVRRERDMSDVKTDWKTVDDPETVKKARDNYDSTIEAFNAIIDFQRTWVGSYLNKLSKDLADVASSAGMRQGTEDLGISNVPFASKTYNYTKQLMLALKVDAIVDEVVKEIEAGRHPVIALENTMGSLLSEYTPGDTITETTFAASLLKGLRGVLRYTITDEDGAKVQEELTPEQLGADGEAAYYEVEDIIRESTSGIFISPLDAIIEKLQAKGYKVGELTGRNEMAVKDEDTGEYKVQRRTDKDKKKLARDFNSGALDVLILNKSASTGISLHASEKFSDQRQRTMIIAQPLADINDYMQMIGRIDRTGQVARGYYINLGLPVPAEGRFLMMLSTKLKSLNANTTTSQESESNDVEAPDLLNKYGSKVIIEYLRDNPDIYVKMGEPLKKEKAKVPVSQLDDYEAQEDDARKITGYVALLPTSEQDDFYNDVVRRYNDLIKYLNDTGSNDLKISVMPLRARTIEKQVSSEGTDPNGNNPFAKDAYVEWVEMDVLKKPMKAAEIGKVIDQLSPDGEESVNKILDTVEKEYQTKMNKESARYEAAKAKAEESINEQREKINNSKRTEQQKLEAIDKLISDKRRAVEESHDNMVNKIDASRDRLDRYLKMFKVGDSVLVPDDLTTDAFLGSSPGIFCGFKAKDEGITPSTTLAVFCTLDGRRKIEVKLSDWAALVRIDNMTEQNWDAAHEVTLSNWDSQIPSETRKHGYIMTGNILQAFADAGEEGKVPGQLVTYTDIDGGVHDGILMNQHWEPSKLKGSNVPLKSRMEEIKNLPNGDHIISADGNVVIDRYYGYYTISVPKSKKIGGQYYENDRLLSLIDRQNFYPFRGQLRGDVENKDIEEVVNVLSDLGVQVKSESQVKFDTETEMGQAMASRINRAITTYDPIEAISQAAESFRESQEERGDNLEDIRNYIYNLPKTYGLKGTAITQVINSREELEALRGKISSLAFDAIEEDYNNPLTEGVYLPRWKMVVVFGEKIKNKLHGEKAWWHEQTHSFWQKLSDEERKRFGEACFTFLENNYKNLYDHIKAKYERKDWLNEACSYLIGEVVEKYGTKDFLELPFEDTGEISIFATELRNYIKYGKREADNDQVQRNEGKSKRGVRSGRSDLRGRNDKQKGFEQEVEEVNRSISDPLDAIHNAADGFRDGQVNNPSVHSAREVYNERLNRVETVFSEAYQDAMVSLKTAQNAIAGDKEIPDSQNAYMAENLMHGKNKNEQDLYNKMFRDPLIDTINEIMNLTGMNWGDVDRYVYTMSGLERNREFYVRDWLEAERNKSIRKYEDLSPAEQDIYDDMANTIETMFEDGDIETEEEKNKKLDQALQRAHEQYIREVENGWIGTKNQSYDQLRNGYINYADYLAALDDFIFNNIDDDYKPAEHDYSGFRAMYGDENGEYDEAEIIDELMNTEGEMDWYDAEGNTMVDNLWRQINDATRYGLERYREAGMRSDEQIDSIEQMFHFYVPMRGFKDDTGEDMYQYFTSKDKAKSYVGGLLKHAKGRGSEANYPISTIFAMTYKAISDCNQNLVNQKLYRLCQANPNDLIILSDSWAVYNDALGIWEEVAPEIPDDASEEDVRQITLAWEERMNDLANEEKAKKITGRAQFDYKPMDKRKQSEHIIDVRINGKPRKMIVTSNPRMAQALNGQLRFERGKNVFSKWNAAIKNMMAALFTSYSPTFALRNMFRDWTHFRTMLGVREGEGYAKQANKYYRQSLFKMVGLFKKYREGTLDESNEMERDFKDFMDNGGVTGFVQMQKIDDIQKQMEKLYNQQKQGKTIQLNNKLWDYTLGAIEAVNEGIENNARFATYRASRHYANRTKARSAYDAKEITVNFNRKGAGGKTYGYKSQSKKVEDAAKVFGVTSQIFGEGRLFFNATVQAIATTFKNFQNPDGSLNKPYIAKWAAKYALPPFMFGLLLPAINEALANAFGGDGDDDPYANLPEWTRRRNLCFYIGNNNFLTIPIGQELAAFLALGDIVAGNTYAQDLKPVDRRIDDELVGVMNTFSPVDIDTKLTKGGFTEDPIDETVGRTFSVLAPLVAIQQNLGWTGRPIYREDKFQNDQYTPEYQMVYSGTNPVLVNASKMLHELGGGDDVTRGKLEVNPAIVQYLWEQYTGGPGKVFSNTISIGKDAKDILVEGEAPDFNIRKVEGLKAFVSQGDDRTQYYRTQAKYRKYMEDAKRMKDAENGYKQSAATDPLAITKLEKMSASEDYVRMQIILEADKSLSKINKAANKADGKERKELRQLYNEQVKQVVDMLDQVGKE